MGHLQPNEFKIIIINILKQHNMHCIIATYIGTFCNKTLNALSISINSVLCASTQTHQPVCAPLNATKIAAIKAAFTRAILRVGGLLHLTADTQKAVEWRVS